MVGRIFESRGGGGQTSGIQTMFSWARPDSEVLIKQAYRTPLMALQP